ncbi:tetratricopeptide repeat protein, partial [bacterium]|nr:tetratricopeptide repeat protein [bacterium]
MINFVGRFFLLTVMAMMFSCSSLHLSTTNETAKTAYKEGLKYEKQGEIGWRKAIDAYRKAVREDAAFVEAYSSLGRLYELRGHYQQAAENYKLALTIQPNESGLYLAYGRALFNSGRYQDALKYLQQYNAFFPLDREGIELLAETQRVLGDPNAEVLYLQLAEIDTGSVDALKGLANYYYEGRQYSKALPYFRKLMNVTKITDANIFYQFGYCLVQTQQWNEAQKQFENAVMLNGQNELFKEYSDIVAKITKGLFHGEAFEQYLSAVYQVDVAETSKEKLPLYKNAIELLNSALTLEPSFILAHKELARVNYTLGKDDDALKSYEFLISAGKASKYDYTNAAYLSFRKDHLEKAKTYYEASLLIDPSQTDVQHYLQTIEKILNGSIKKESYFFYDKGAKASVADSAEWYLKKAIAIDSSYYEAYLELGNLQMRIGKYRDAEATFTKGLQLSTESDIQATFHYNLALTYARRDLHDKAIAQFQKTLELDPGDSDALYNLSKTYLDKSDLPNAIKTYDRLIKDNPDYFQPSLNEIEEFALDQSHGINASKSVNMASVLKIGQTNTYTLKIKSKNDALFGADANGDASRELTIAFREQVQDISEFGEVEFALDILTVEGYALLPQEKKSIGQRLYLKISDVYGVTNIYGLLEENPYSLARFVIAVMEDLHGAYLRRSVAEGEMWRSGQYIFKLGSVDAVMVLDEVDGSIARGTKYYGVTGSYDAARYGDVGRVYVFNKGTQTFEYDTKKNLIAKLNNQFTTKLFSESTAKMEIQEASYELALKDMRFEQLEKPKKVVISDIPYVKQHGPQCAAASLSMVLAHYKQPIDQDDIYATIKSDFAGAQLNDIVNYPRSLGKYKAFGYLGTLEDLKDRIDQGIPVLVFLTPFGGGHVVVVIGYDETKHQIIMHDPTVANDHAVAYDDFLREWKQSGNECAIVAPFDKNIIVTEGPITTNKAV